VRAAPAVSCARCTKECAHEHTGSAEAIRPSLRNGFTAYFVISPAIGLSCHRRPAKPDLSAPGWADLPSRDLTPASRRQDHTTSPSAAVLRQNLRQAWYPSAEVLAKASLASVVCALCHRSQAKPALRHFARPTLPRPPHPAPTFVTMANAPLSGQDGDGYKGDLGLLKIRIFLQKGLDRVSRGERSDLPVGCGWQSLCRSLRPSLRAERSNPSGRICPSGKIRLIRSNNAL
jgi:hypothetical protein